MDQYEDFKGHYLIMGNAPIHEHENIKLYVESRSYRCVHLPPYSPGFNPIEAFFSYLKKHVRRQGKWQASEFDTPEQFGTFLEECVDAVSNTRAFQEGRRRYRFKG